MDIINAAHRIQDGKKIRRAKWNHDYYIWLVRGLLIDSYNQRQEKFTLDEILSDDWELFNEINETEL